MHNLPKVLRFDLESKAQHSMGPCKTCRYAVADHIRDVTNMVEEVA